MEGLLLCHADARAGDDEGAIPVVTLAPLAEEIAAGEGVCDLLMVWA